jgi:PAS domain S-box-containing protein
MGKLNRIRTPLPQGSPGAKLLKNLNWFTVSIFLIAMAMMIGVGLFYTARGVIDTRMFLISFALFTAFIVAVGISANIIVRRMLLHHLLYKNGLVTISEISTDAVLFWGTDNIVLTWSTGAENAFGYSADEAVGILDIARLFPADQLDDLMDMLSSEQGGAVRDLRITGKRRSGERFPLEASVSLITVPEEQALGALAVMRDVTERDRMERLLVESEERYRALFGSSADGICYSDSDGVIQECNQAFADMLGRPVMELKGMSFEELTPEGECRDALEEFARKMREHGYSDELSTRYMTCSGAYIPVSVRSWMVYNDDGEPVGAWAIVRNQSERVRYEELIRDTMTHLEQANDRLQELDRLKTELVAVVSHELRAPLGAIESSLNAMRCMQSEALDEEREKLMGVLDRGVRRLSDLVEDLMDLTRIESGQLKLEKAPVDVSDLAERVVSSFEDRFLEKGLQITFSNNDGVCTVDCDPSRIEQVLTNLIDNAFKYTDEGGVTVGIDRAPRSVAFTVSDSGIGIPPGLGDKIFEKFFCLDAPCNNGKQGIGLGLAICRGIVEAHGGSIDVESKQGEGTTFCFSLPA